MSGPVRWDVAFYNLRVGRPQLRVREEIAAIMLDDPTILAGCEATGYVLPEISGYRLLRSRRNQSHANLFAYVSQDVKVSRVRWTRMRQTWRRVKHPNLGNHEPRSILKFRANGVKVSVTHAPQIDPGNTDAARNELIKALTGRMAPWRRWRFWNFLPARVRATESARPALTLWDPNGLGGVLAAKVSGRQFGTAVEGVVIRGEIAGSTPKFPRFVHGVELKSDHGRMFKIGLFVTRRWTVE